jgi:hypothetical protein
MTNSKMEKISSALFPQYFSSSSNEKQIMSLFCLNKNVKMTEKHAICEIFLPASSYDIFLKNFLSISTHVILISLYFMLYNTICQVF